MFLREQRRADFPISYRGDIFTSKLRTPEVFSSQLGSVKILEAWKLTGNVKGSNFH